MIHVSGSALYLLPYIVPGNGLVEATIVSVNREQIRFANKGNWENYHLYITVEYTKTD